MSSHGTRARYVTGCRCDDCRTANLAYYHHRNRAKLYGTWQPNRTSAEPIRQHVHQLRAAGMGANRIAELAGVSKTVIQNLFRSKRTGQPCEWVRRDTAARILAVSLDVAGGALVDATGTRRRLQALVAVGWSQAVLAQRVGWNRANFARLIVADHCRQETAEKVAALYDELWDQRPAHRTRYQRASFTRATRHAELHGWVPPLAWDDIDNDPEPLDVVRRSGRRSVEEWLEDFEHTRDHHQGDIGLAALRLGVSRDALDQALSRARRMGVAS